MGGTTSEGQHVGLVRRDQFTSGINAQSARDWVHGKCVGGGTTLECHFFVANMAVWGVVDRFGKNLGHSSCGVMRSGLDLLSLSENYQSSI